MNEVLRVYDWLYNTLADDATVASLVGARIYAGAAPQEAAPPVVIFNHMAGNDLMGVGTARVLNNSIYQVKGVTKGRSHATGKQIADAIDAVLHGQDVSADGVHVTCVRESALVYGQSDNGEEFRHAGGVYRIYVYEEGA